MSQKKESGFLIVRLIPVMLAVAFVPLISVAKRYENKLTDFPWFSNTGNSVDIFLYWKGQALIFLAFAMLVFLAFSLIEREWTPRFRLWKTPEFLCMSAYLLLVVLSSLFSEHREFSISGGYEQWEGMNVLLAYGVLFMYVYLTLDSERQLKSLVYALIVGGVVLGLIGTFQYMGMDLFRSQFGQIIMNIMTAKKMKFTFNFPEGWVYATLYNPNYVGSYAALLLPLLVGVSFLEWKKLPVPWTIAGMAGACLMLITLFGSQSLTGCIGVLGGIVFAAVMRFPNLLKKLGVKKMLLGAGGVAVLFVIALFLFHGQIQYGVDKLLHPTKNNHLVKSILSTEDGLQITTVKGDVCYIDVTGDTEDPFDVRDEDGQSLEIIKDSGENFYTFGDDGFANFRLYPKTVAAGNSGKVYEAVRIVNPNINREWTLIKTGDSYKIYNSLGKIDELRKIPAWGFEDRQHFASKRGYIWSRTIPVLKKYLFLGAGPDNFTVAFPNYDYVGKMNMDYDGVSVTKPHNMYFQIWAQTGLLSLIAYLLLVGLYLFRSVRLYWKRRLSSVSENIGFAVMISVAGYLVTGLANDSTITVAPVFWAMLAMGFCINRYVGKMEGKEH